MQIYALFMFLGIFTTLLIPETKRKTLEELSGEDHYGGDPSASNSARANGEKVDDQPEIPEASKGT